jgi:Fe-S oxidoreductase
MRTLRDEIEQGIPIVGLEPSCIATFRDELTQLFPMDEDAKRLSEQTFTLAEFLEKRVKSYRFPHLRRRALVHGHCHHKSLMKIGPEDQVFQKLGMLYEIPDTDCCGLAGSFGFEASHDAISRQIGEHKLIPMVRGSAKDTLIVADGFSCKHQIQEMTDRRALHLAQVLQMSLHEASDGPPGGYPEARQPDVRLDGPERSRALARTGAVLGLGALLVGGAAYALAHRRDWT